MHNLFIMNQSVNCEVFVSFSYILEMHLLVFKVFKIYTKHGVLVHGLPLWTNPTLKIFTSRVLMNFTNLKWTKLCQFKIILSGLKASHITHLLIFFFLNSTQWVWFSPEGETI